MIKRMDKSHVKEIAKIHLSYFKNAFLCDLGQRFLKKLYENIVSSKQCIGYVYLENNEIAGFTTGSKNMDKFFKSFIIKNFLTLSLPISISIIKKPKIIKNIIETFFYSKKSKIKGIDAELISVAVKKKLRRKGVGRKLNKELVNYFQKNKMKRFKVMVDKDNDLANKYYIGLGYKLHREFVMYGKKINLYTRNI